MEIFTWNDVQNFLNTGIQNSFFDKGCGISVGSFDGLHLGHRQLISELVEKCNIENIRPGLVTFKRPLPSIKHSGDYQGDLSTLDQRLKLFEQIGIEFVIIVDFDDTFASLLGTDFFNILVNACNLQIIAEGVDFRCGYKGATDTQAIRYFAEKNNIETIFLSPVYYREGSDEEERVSSSFIRSMVLKGFFSTVEELLKRPYQIDLKDIKDFEIIDNKYYYPIKKINQVIPPNGIYLCKDNNSETVRIEITDENIISNMGNLTSISF
ncbi:MAG: FAD synthetase family protein [Treponema sp.]|nr:FAD synthetase family protein [Treponema sp.]